MASLRSTIPADRPHTRSLHPLDVATHLFRTGTVLQSARGLLATALLFLGTLSWGFSPEAVPAEAMGRIAEYHRPGAIGAPGRLQPGPRPESMLPPHVQPVAIHGPAGTLLAIETAEGWSPLAAGPLRLGLVIGQAYRLRIGGIQGREGEELFPSVRILARLGTPPGMEWRFPVEVILDADDLSEALSGGLVRRVVYVSCETDSPDLVPAGWFDVKPGDDAFEVARTLGDPIAEVVIGNRVPAPGSVP
jgi:hypothetical protein